MFLPSYYWNYVVSALNFPNQFRLLDLALSHRGTQQDLIKKAVLPLSRARL